MRKPSRKFNVIWKETYRRNIKSAGVIVMMFFPIILMGIVSLVNGVISSQTQEASYRKIGVVTQDTGLVAYLQQQVPTFEYIVSDETTAKKQLSDDVTAGYLTLGYDNNQQLQVSYSRKTTSEDTNLSTLEQALSAYQLQKTATDMSLDAHQLSQLMTSKVAIRTYKLNAEKLENGEIVIDQDQDLKDLVRQGISYVAVIFLYIFLITYGSVIGQEIASEKGTRVMEVILSSTDAITHFKGKIVGISLVVLTQLMVYAVLGFGYYLTFGKDLIATWLSGIDIVGLAGSMLLYTAVFIIVGGLLYIILSATLGSIASRVEDVQKVLFPVILFNIIGLYVGMFALAMPNNIVVKIASWFPLLTPFVMPFRVATDTVNTAELWGAITLTLLFAVLVYKVGAGFYKSNVLIYSDKGPLQVLKQSWALLREEKNK